MSQEVMNEAWALVQSWSVASFYDASRVNGSVVGVCGSLWGFFLKCALLGVSGKIALSTLHFRPETWASSEGA